MFDSYIYLFFFFFLLFFFFQAEDGIRDLYVTGVQTCALPISSAHAVPSAQLRDAVDGFERGDRVGPRGLPGPRLGSRREGREGIADVEQHLEQQLLALVGGVEVRHADLVAGGLRAVVGLAVDGLKIAEDAIAGAWHGQKI